MKTFKQILNEIYSDSHDLGTPVLIHQGQHSLPKHLREWTELIPSLSANRAMSEYYRNQKINAHLNGGNDPEFSRTEDLLHQHYHGNNLDDSQKEALRDYTMSSYDLNEHLFNRHNQGKGPQTNLFQIQHLDRVMHNNPLPDHLKHLDVFSGVKFNVSEKLKEGNGKLFLPAYTSTSLSPSTASDFASEFKPGTEEEAWTPGRTNEQNERHVIRIRVPASHPGYYIGKNSASKLEQEFILPRGTQLTVHPKPTILRHRNYEPGNTGPISTVNVWHARANYVGPRYG